MSGGPLYRVRRARKTYPCGSDGLGAPNCRRLASSAARAFWPRCWGVPMPETFVRIDPSMHFGRPLIGGSSVETVAGTVWAGDPVDEVAEEFGLTAAQVLVACWYQARYGTRTWQRRWGEWAQANETHLWHGHHDKVDDPPAVERG